MRVLAFCPDVQRELGLTSKQKASLANALRGRSGPAAIPADNSEPARNLAARVYPILGENQRRRLLQILYQSDPLTMFTTPSIAQALHLSKVQRSWLKATALQFDGHESDNGVAFLSGAHESLSMGGPIVDYYDKVQSLYATGHSYSILTSRQKAVWRHLTGRPFKTRCPICQRYWHPRRIQLSANKQQ